MSRPRTGMAARRLALAAGLAASLGGCGIGLPVATRSETPATGVSRAPRGAAVSVGKLGGTPGSSGSAGSSGSVASFGSPAATVRAFAAAYINWDAADVASRLDALAKESVGRARSELALEAAQTRDDVTLRRGGIANAGTVEAVVRLSGGAHRYLVVTRERTTATDRRGYQGLAPAWHVSLATVTLVAAGGARGGDHRRRGVRGGGRSGGARGGSRRRGARRASHERWAVSAWQPQS